MVKMETLTELGESPERRGSKYNPSRALTAMVKSVEKNDLSSLRILLEATKDLSISEPMVKTVLPRQYRKVAGPVLTTPLRVSITWRNMDAFRMIINSQCKISDEDKGLAMQKLSRRINGDTEIAMFDLLLQASSTMMSPVHYTIAIENLINDGKEHVLKRLLDIHCSARVTTKTRGYLCLALGSKGRNSTEADRSGYFLDKWRETAADGMIGLLRTGFNPGQFLLSRDCWDSLETKYFHTVISLLPLFIQVSTDPSQTNIAAILRRVSRDFWYPMLKDPGRSVLHALPRLLWNTGYDLKAILSAACLSPRLERQLKFNEWATRKPEVRSLKDLCRHSVRINLNASNVLEGIEKIPFFPKKLRDFMLYKDYLEESNISGKDCICLSL